MCYALDMLETVPAFKETSDTLEVMDPGPEPSASSPLAGLSYDEAVELLRPRSGVGPGLGPEPAPAPKTIEQKLETWSAKAPKTGYDRVRFRGVMMNARTKQLLRRAEKIMRQHFDHAGFRFQVTQGSYNDSVSASAGTHDGGGALDIHTRTHPKRVVDDMVRAMRMAGFAAWSRGRGHDPLDPHIHAIAIGDKELAPIAKAQVADFAKGKNGLKGHAKDPDAGLKAGVPDWAQHKLDKLA